MVGPYERLTRIDMRWGGCLVLTLIVFAACLLPFIFVDLANQALRNLHLSPTSAMLVFLGILFGSAVNLPVVRFPTDEEALVPPPMPFETFGFGMPAARLRREVIVTVNVGGCVVPVLLAVWLSRFIVDGGSRVVLVLLAGMVVNAVVCYFFSRPIPHLGIALPMFLPAAVALLVTWLGLAAERFDDYRSPVAFVIGISGPLVGADLLRWKDFPKIGAAIISIGGAGTWDGIVLSGLLASLLA